MDNLLDSEPMQIGGWTTVGLTISTTIVEWISTVTVNDVLQGVLALLGILFLSYRVLTQRIILRNELLDEQLKKKQLEEKE
jgi:hypothetical protein